MLYNSVYCEIRRVMMDSPLVLAIPHSLPIIVGYVTFNSLNKELP